MKSEHLSEVSLRLTRLLRLGGLAGDSKLGKKNPRAKRMGKGDMFDWGLVDSRSEIGR